MPLTVAHVVTVAVPSLAPLHRTEIRYAKITSSRAKATGSTKKTYLMSLLRNLRSLVPIIIAVRRTSSPWCQKFIKLSKIASSSCSYMYTNRHLVAFSRRRPRISCCVRRTRLRERESEIFGGLNFRAPFRCFASNPSITLSSWFAFVAVLWQIIFISPWQRAYYFRYSNGVWPLRDKI